MLCKGEGGEIRSAVTKVTKNIVDSACTNLSVYVSPTALQGTLVRVHSRHETSLQSSREEQTLPVSTGEGPLFTHICFFVHTITPTGKEV